MKHETGEVADILESVRGVVEPIVEEVEGEEEVLKLREENDYVDSVQVRPLEITLAVFEMTCQALTAIKKMGHRDRLVCASHYP